MKRFDKDWAMPSRHFKVHREVALQSDAAPHQTAHREADRARVCAFFYFSFLLSPPCRSPSLRGSEITEAVHVQPPSANISYHFSIQFHRKSSTWKFRLWEDGHLDKRRVLCSFAVLHGLAWSPAIDVRRYLERCQDDRKKYNYLA